MVVYIVTASFLACLIPYNFVNYFIYIYLYIFNWFIYIIIV